VVFDGHDENEEMQSMTIEEEYDVSRQRGVEILPLNDRSVLDPLDRAEPGMEQQIGF
jgi:hypothetical protein